MPGEPSLGPEKVRSGLFQGVASIRRTKSVVFACSFSARAELRSRHCVHALQVGRCNFHADNSTRSIDISDDRSLCQGRLTNVAQHEIDHHDHDYYEQYGEADADGDEVPGFSAGKISFPVVA